MNWKTIWNQKRKTLAAIAVCLIAAFALGILFAPTFQKKNPAAPVDVHVDSPDFKFINPLLFSRISKDFFADEFKNYNNEISSFIASSTSAHKADKVSVYLRELDNGHWTGIGENQTYEPASMLKVVVMIAILRLAAENPALLSEELPYTGADDSGQHYKPESALPEGNHSVKELMSAMIINSDNGAANSLLSDGDIGKAFEDTYKGFRLPTINSATTTDFMSARSYSVIFRSLYNATYLPWNLSEQALGLLSYSKFDKGIAAGVPAGTVVAHKFGEYSHTPATATSQNELHDCGIVYYPNHPYLLCVMAAGENFTSLESVLSDVSKITYDHIKASVQ